MKDENCEKIIKKFRFQQKAELSMVDDTGLEPVTPCTSSRCSSQLS